MRAQVKHAREFGQSLSLLKAKAGMASGHCVHARDSFSSGNCRRQGSECCATPPNLWSNRCNEFDYFPNSATIHNERLWLSRQHFLLAEVMKPRPVQTYQSVAMDSLSLRNVLLSSLTRLVNAFSTS